MTEGQLGARLEILLSQRRFGDAEQLLMHFLEQFPSSKQGQYMLSAVYYNQNKLDESRVLIESLLNDEPDQTHYLALSARIDLAQELYARAEEKCEFLIAQDPGDEEYYNLMATIKFNQRNYDKTIYFADKALEINPEDLTALNLKTSASGILGRKDEALLTIQEALETDPNNDWSIANHGRQLLNEGKVKEALERFNEALSINPNNDLAQYGLKEALKSKFWPYKLFYKFQMFMSRLDQKKMWTVIIGTYVLLQVLQRAADKFPQLGIFLYPIVAIIVIIFISSWIINPLMNLYLLSNKYGQILLDEDDKKAAKYVGISLLISIIAFLLYFLLKSDAFLMMGIFFVALMIPLGTMFSPPNPDGRKKTKLFTLGILIIGLLGLLMIFMAGDDKLIFVSFAGIFIYQWYLNSVMIKAGARMMD